jgi:hypothetical protein
MPRVKQSQLARARGGNEMSQSVAARMTRNKMRADWDTVHAILTDPKSPRRDASGRDVFERADRPEHDLASGENRVSVSRS